MLQAYRWLQLHWHCAQTRGNLLDWRHVLLPSEGAHPQDQTRTAQPQSSDRLRQNRVAVFVMVSHGPAGRTTAPNLCQAKVQDVEKVRCARHNHQKTSSFKASGSTSGESRERGAGHAVDAGFGPSGNKLSGKGQISSAEGWK